LRIVRGAKHVDISSQYPLRGEGVPIISRVVEHGETVYVSGMLSNPVGDIATQTKQVVDRQCLVPKGVDPLFVPL